LLEVEGMLCTLAEEELIFALKEAASAGAPDMVMSKTAIRAASVRRIILDFFIQSPNLYRISI